MTPKESLLHFVTEVLPKAIELEATLPQIHLRMPVADFLHQNDALWPTVVVQITAQYPQYAALLSRADLAFRVVYRPINNRESLPGFDDTNENTRTLSFRYGMDYRPENGEYVGMTRTNPWTYYMLPDARHYPSDEYHTFIYIYDNADNQLVGEGQTTVGPILRDNYLTDYLRMIVDVVWVDVEPELDIDPLVHDASLESLADLFNRAGL